MYRDCRNLVVTASSLESAELLDSATTSYLGMRRDVSDNAAAVVHMDPECPLGHCLVGYLHLHAGKRETIAHAQQSLARAKACTRHATPRENLHTGALEAWTNGDFVRALDHWEQVLAGFPTDALALRLAQFMTSYLGRSQALADSVARAWPAWDRALPGYGFVLGCYAYGLEEAGDYARAEPLGRAALELNPHDLWATHAVAHVMEMQSRIREGITFLESAWGHLSECGTFLRHVWWHQCLFFLSLGDYDAVLDLYDRQVRRESTDEFLDIANSASLLWRLEQLGAAVGNRWDELAARASARMHDHVYVLADLHYAMALAAAVPGTCDSFLDSCTAFARDQVSTEAKIMKSVGVAVVHAIRHHRNGRFSAAVDAALPVKDGFPLIGGSHAQRDIFDYLLIDAAVRADRLPLARSLLVERTNRRPCDLWSWRQLAKVDRMLRDEAGAAIAEDKAKLLLNPAGGNNP